MSTQARHHKLDNLRHLVDGNEDAVNQMISVFLQSTPDVLKDLNANFDQGNWEQFAKTAHKLKSSIDLFQIDEMSKSVREMESMAKAGEGAEKIQPLVTRMNVVLREVFEDLSD